jgi:hypothetical protein
MQPGFSFDFDAAVVAPFRMQPGLRRLAPDACPLRGLVPDSPAFAEKLAVLSGDPASALLCTDGFDARPAWRALAQEAARQCGDAIAIDDAGVVARRLGWRVCWSGATVEPETSAHAKAGACLQSLPEPLRVAGLLSLALHADFAIVDGAGGTLPALAVCLPSHWAPTDKIGRSFAAVHAPVADNATLLAASRHLMQLVCQPQRWERFVWNVTPHPAHDQHPARHGRQPWPDDPGSVIRTAIWRTEHQTFIPLPELQQAVFTIHVEVQPLAEAITTSQRAAALRAAIATMSEAALDYRGLGTARSALLDWLAGRAGA